MATLEEAQQTNNLNEMVENNLSSVKFVHNSRGNTWEIKAYHADIEVAKESVLKIHKEFEQNYGKIN